MPRSEAVPILRVADAAASLAWYERLGYEKEWEHRFEPAFPVFMAVSRQGDARLFLSEHSGDGVTGTLVHLAVEDAGALAAALGGEVTAQPWGDELHLTDPDGNRFRIVTARA